MSIYEKIILVILVIISVPLIARFAIWLNKYFPCDYGD